MPHEAVNVPSDPPIRGFIGQYAFLSNFYPVEITYGGITYPSVEHAYQAQKAQNDGIKQRIAKLSSPGAAKRYGAKLPRPVAWDYTRLDHMEKLLALKFSPPNISLISKLLDTGDAILEETNWWGDNYWGVCNGSGDNALGILLMGLRNRLKLVLANPMKPSNQLISMEIKIHEGSQDSSQGSSSAATGSEQ